MTDRELLELAAKAAGIEYSSDIFFWKHEDHCAVFWDSLPEPCCTCGAEWNPLEDDGDALRLAVKLGLDVCIDQRYEENARTHALGFIKPVGYETISVVEAHGDPYAATRRAIVRAAAEIGKEKNT